MSDVRVYGLGMGTVHIADIAMDVPHEVTVDIPASKATHSKDLWRLIAQKQLFRLTPGGPHPFKHTPTAPPVHDSAAEDRLREDNRLLLEQNRLLRQAIDSQGGKLDTILGMLASGAVAPVGTHVRASKPASDVVEIEVPTYIPSEIKPQNVESHVEVLSETSEGSSVAGAGAALRKLRQRGK
jgi:hypothetical protein